MGDTQGMHLEANVHETNCSGAAYLGCQLDVAAAAIQSLLVLDGVLEHNGLSLVVEVGCLCRQIVPAVVCASLDTCRHIDDNSAAARC